MSKKYNYAIVIGRFQPYHKGHHELLSLAKETADKVIVVIGSHNQPRSAKNPFTSEERISFIKNALGIYPPMKIEVPGIGVIENSKPKIFGQTSTENKDIFEFITVEDTYQDTEWSLSVQNQIYRITGTNAKICLIGADKDKTTYYLKQHFKMWDFIDSKLLSVGLVDATTVRQSLFDKNHNFEEMKPYLLDCVYTNILQWKENRQTEFQNLCREHEFLVKTRKESQVGPYPVQFIAADAVVFYGGQVLLVQRKGPLGNGLWALPGGYVEDNETFYDCAIRELIEETKIDIPEKVLHGSFKNSRIFDAPGRSLRGRIVTVAHGFLLDSTYKRPDVSRNPLPQTQSTDETYKAWWFSFGELYQMRNQIFEDHFNIIQYFISTIVNQSSR